MGNEALGLKTNRQLLDALKDAVGRKLTAAEVTEQRISFVYGSLDSASNVTKERIRQVISEQEGVALTSR